MSDIRSFVAVPLPPRVQGAIFDAARNMAAVLPDLKWSRKPGNLHVTIKFLGRVEEGLLARFGAALSEAVAVVPGFSIALQGFGAFPSARRANVIWAGVQDPLGLEAVAAIVEQVGGRFGFAPDDRPFRGHITVGRARDRRQPVDARAALAPLADLRFGEAWVGEVHLYESILGGDGSTYVLRGKATLEGATHGDVREEREQGN